MTRFTGTSKFQSLSMIKKYDYCKWSEGNYYFFYHRLIECKENNFSSFLYNSLLATMYTC